jgi:hypothetical protein
MTAATHDEESRTPVTIADERPATRDGMSVVHEEIVRGLARVVTEAGHQGVMYVHNWIKDTDYGKDESAESARALRDADQCLELALEYVRRLRDELRQRVCYRDDTDVPF